MSDIKSRKMLGNEKMLPSLLNLPDYIIHHEEHEENPRICRVRCAYPFGIHHKDEVKTDDKA